MKLSDLYTSKDGSISLTKLAASTFHLNLAIAVMWHTYTKDFSVDVWVLYGAFAVGHAGYDKTMAVVKDFKSKQLEQTNAGPT
jgi:hypothetical protein